MQDILYSSFYQLYAHENKSSPPTSEIHYYKVEW